MGWKEDRDEARGVWNVSISSECKPFCSGEEDVLEAATEGQRSPRLVD